MSKSLETIVRPFASDDVFTRARSAPITQPPTIEPPELVATSWEGSPDTSYTDEGNAWYGSWDSDLKEDKSQRISRTVRVENPDDKDQHVFVERIDKAVFKNDAGQTQSLKFDWSSPKDGGS